VFLGLDAYLQLLVDLLSETGIEALPRTLVCRDVLPFALRPVRDVKCGLHPNVSAVGIGRPFWDLNTTTDVARTAEGAWDGLGLSSSDYNPGAGADFTAGVSVVGFGDTLNSTDGPVDRVITLVDVFLAGSR
jgi:hypothetical protein